jgi:MOSC domain-containing protein YiiM
VKVGDPVSTEPYQGETLSILQMYRAHYQKDKSEELYRLHLNAPIDIRTRRKMEDELQKLLQSK